MSRYYGALKDKKRLPRVHQYTARAIPQIIDLSMYRPAVINQGQVGRCVGCGIAGEMSAHLTKLGGNAGRTVVISPDDLYNLGREKEGDLNVDAGTEPSDVLLMIQEYGAIPYKDWPLTPTLDTENPLTPTREGEAVKYPNFKPTYVDVSNPQTALQNILDAMATGHTLNWAFPWFTAWETYSSGMLSMQTATDPIGGGHDTFSFYADTVKRYFWGQNSWGTVDFGAANQYPGCYMLPFDMIPVLAQMGMDCEYVDFDLGTPTPPTPTPTPTPKPKKKCWIFETLDARRADKGR